MSQFVTEQNHSASRRDTAYSVKRRVTILAAVANLLLGIGKVTAGYLGQSHALIADGVHSVSDLLSDALVYVAVSVGGEGPDENHPYGHARIETAATAGIGLMLILVAAGFVYNAGQRLLSPEDLWVPGWLALGAAAVSVVIKEIMYQYTLRAAAAANSSLLEANAWHHRSDALSSLVVIGGVAGTMVGIVWLDAMAAVFVAIMIAQVGWRLGFQSLQELVDTGVADEDLHQLKQRIDAVDGVRSHHGLRTRRMGADVLADVHIRVDPAVTVSEAHRIAETVSSELRSSMDALNEVLVHVDHESAAAAARSLELPPPAEVRGALEQAWKGLDADVSAERIGLHYRDGHIDVDLLLPAPCPPTAEAQALADRLRNAARGVGRIGRVRLLYHVDAGPV